MTNTPCVLPATGFEPGPSPPKIKHARKVDNRCLPESLTTATTTWAFQCQGVATVIWTVVPVSAYDFWVISGP